MMISLVMTLWLAPWIQDDRPDTAVPPSDTEPLRTNWVIAEMERADSDLDGQITYLEARDIQSLDLDTFRQIDRDESGKLDLREMEIFQVLQAEENGYPIERSLRTRALAEVEKEEEARAEAVAKESGAYALQQILEASLHGSWEGAPRRRATGTKLYRKLLPSTPRPISPYHPRQRGY